MKIIKKLWLIMKIIKIENTSKKDLLRIEYMLGNLCNHRCHYCFPGSNEGDQPWPDLETVKQNLSHLLTKYEEYGKSKSNLFFIGGEPTIWKGLSDLCRYLKTKHNVVIEISSNGSRSVDWWKREGNNFDHVCVSVHREYAKLDHIVEVCDTLFELGVFVNADVLIDPLAFDQCCENIEYLKTHSKYDWPIIAKVVHFDGEHRYLPDQLQFFNESIKRYPSIEWYNNTSKKPLTSISITTDDGQIINTNSDSWITRNKLNYFKGWECNLGVDILKIFSDGRITGNCQEKLYKNNFDYNLYDDNFVDTFKPDIQPVICSKPVCACNEEVVLTKRMILPE